nr:Sec-independent protein translocase subunit TatA [Petropleomorpha daqingensis]
MGPLEIGLIILAVLLLFGYKKLPDASRSLGRSLRIFKGEMKGMKDDGTPSATRPVVVPGEVDLEAVRLDEQARAAEAHAAEARARADAARASVSDPIR